MRLVVLIVALCLMAYRLPLAEGQQQRPPGASFDTAPVEFSVSGVQYRIPRNYIITMSDWSGGPQGMVTIRVNLPDLKPLTKETENCFSTNSFGIAFNGAHWTKDCKPFQFIIEGRGVTSADQAFASVRKMFYNQVPITGPVGFEKYQIGSDAHAEYYKKIVDGRTLLYACTIVDLHGKREGNCLPAGNFQVTGPELGYMFPLNDIDEIGRDESNIWKLVDSFQVKLKP